MAEFFSSLGPLWTILGLVIIVLLCLAGIVLSCLSISGTWLVAAASLIAIFTSGDEFPGWWTLVIFILLSAGVEVVEAIAGTWGVIKRGGSKLAGFLAGVGGLVGMFAGTLIPIPIAGPLIGMLVCSFALAYAAERYRLKKSEPALSIAWGAVVARVLVVLVKVTVTLGMAGALLIGMIFF
jgi:uncharacterized protein YqgC (DUF456 family)